MSRKPDGGICSQFWGKIRKSSAQRTYSHIARITFEFFLGREIDRIQAICRFFFKAGLMRSHSPAAAPPRAKHTKHISGNQEKNQFYLVRRLFVVFFFLLFCPSLSLWNARWRKMKEECVFVVAGVTCEHSIIVRYLFIG